MSGMGTKMIKAGVVAFLVLGLSGCVVAIGNTDEPKNQLASDKAQQDNVKKINQLHIGFTEAEEKTLLGAPDFTEAFQKNGEQVQVLFYRTQLNRRDNKTTKDECTPIVFHGDQLSGWGEKAYNYL
ncbi:MAG: DUF3192 domain-containing protein [Alishewanella sp.]|nr:DUF3192 domain-containing protein [Alishewanella sp.]